MEKAFLFSRRAWFLTAAVVFALIGAHSLNPRELYREMYPLEPVKRDAFNICDQADPTFVRAVGADREACYGSMPHVMQVAMGRVLPGGVLSIEALTDPSREAELLMTLASMPPRQPITAPRLFSNTVWARPSTPCDSNIVIPPVSYSAASDLPPAPTGRAGALNGAIRKNLPALPRPSQAGAVTPEPLPVIPLGQAQPAALPRGKGEKVAAANPLPAPDIGDQAAPAIVPLAPATTCGGA